MFNRIKNWLIGPTSLTLQEHVDLYACDATRSVPPMIGVSRVWDTYTIPLTSLFGDASWRAIVNIHENYTEPNTSVIIARFGSEFDDNRDHLVYHVDSVICGLAILQATPTTLIIVITNKLGTGEILTFCKRNKWDIADRCKIEHAMWPRPFPVRSHVILIPGGYLVPSNSNVIIHSMLISPIPNISINDKHRDLPNKTICVNTTYTNNDGTFTSTEFRETPIKDYIQWLVPSDEDNLFAIKEAAFRQLSCFAPGWVTNLKQDTPTCHKKWFATTTGA